jgi:hypothetical protein
MLTVTNHVYNIQYSRIEKNYMSGYAFGLICVYKTKLSDAAVHYSDCSTVSDASAS